jgi:FtsH-binding integral membrane protein
MNPETKHRRQQIMKKTLGTIVAAAAIVLVTATFGFAEYAATGAANFPYFQLGCLIVGGLILVSLKRKYDKMYTSEVVGAFALYAVLMALFTNPVIDIVKNIVS